MAVGDLADEGRVGHVGDVAFADSSLKGDGSDTSLAMKTRLREDGRIKGFAADSPVEGEGFEPSVALDRDNLRAPTGRYGHTIPKAPVSQVGGASIVVSLRSNVCRTIAMSRNTDDLQGAPPLGIDRLIATRLAGPRVGAFWKPGDPALISLPGPAWLDAR